MKYVTQQIVSAPPSPRPRGDCMRAAVASILERDLEEVPHFVDLQEWIGIYSVSVLNSWLRQDGYNLRAIERNLLSSEKKIQLYYRRAPRYSPGHKRQWSKVGFSFDGQYLMTVDSKIFKGREHMVVAEDDRIIWDPSPRFGTPEYDRKPYVFRGWITFFVPRVISTSRKEK